MHSTFATVYIAQNSEKIIKNSQIVRLIRSSVWLSSRTPEIPSETVV